jgi:hypothetical protein
MVFKHLINFELEIGVLSIHYAIWAGVARAIVWHAERLELHSDPDVVTKKT